MQESIVFLVRVQCRRKESSRSLSHLLMSFLLFKFYDDNINPLQLPAANLSVKLLSCLVSDIMNIK